MRSNYTQSILLQDKRSYKPLGFSLIELMIAMVLGLILLAAVIQFFAGTKLTYTANEALARTQESGRFALETLKPIARSAGINGICGGSVNIRDHLNLADADAQALLNPEQSLRGWEYQASGPGDDVNLNDFDPSDNNASEWVSGVGANQLELPPALMGRVLPFSDVLLIREVRPISGISFTNTTRSEFDPVPFSGTAIPPINQCDILMITDCTRGDVFQNTASSSPLDKATSGCTSVNNLSAQGWSKIWGPETQLYRPMAQAFFIGEGASGEPALFRAEFGGGLDNARFEELADGIENMQILFGYSNPGVGANPGDGQSVNNFLTADQVPNWEYVIAVQIALLARSPGNVDTVAAANTFDLALVNVTHPEDRLLRQPFSATLTLRNRQIVR